MLRCPCPGSSPQHHSSSTTSTRAESAKTAWCPSMPRCSVPARRIPAGQRDELRVLPDTVSIHGLDGELLARHDPAAIRGTWVVVSGTAIPLRRSSWHSAGRHSGGLRANATGSSPPCTHAWPRPEQAVVYSGSAVRTTSASSAANDRTSFNVVPHHLSRWVTSPQQTSRLRIVRRSA